MNRKKEIVEHLCEYGVVCSYDKLKRLRSSVACDASERINQNILKHLIYEQSEADTLPCDDDDDDVNWR